MKAISYYSTNGNSGLVSFKEALIQGLAPDKGLFVPEKIPKMPASQINEMREKEYWEIAFKVMNEFLSEEIPEKKLEKICKDAYNFPVPIEKVFERNYLMRL